MDDFDDLATLPSPPKRPPLVIKPDMAVSVAAKALLHAGGDRGVATAFAMAYRFPPRVVRLIKALPAATTDDGAFGQALSDVSAASRVFFASLQTTSIYFWLLANGFRIVPMRTRLGVVAADASGWIEGEGLPVPVSTMTLAEPLISPRKACAMLVVSDEVARSNAEAALTLVDEELRRAVSATVDTAFWDLVIDTGTPSTPSSGNDAAAMKADLKALLDSVNVTGAGKLAWVMGADAANGASILDDRMAMTPEGGELLGLPALVSSTMPAKTVRLVNAAGIAANADTIELSVSGQADIEMAGSGLIQNATTGLGTTLVSMFQSNSKALKATVNFAVEKMRADAVAELSNVQWGA